MRIVAIAVILVFTSSSWARDIFVNNVLGDDRNGGQRDTVAGERGGPCRSISKALRIATTGDRIVVAKTGQPYRESLTVEGPRHSGTDRFPTMIIGNGATLDGTMPLADANWEFFGNNTFRTRPAHMSYQQLFLDDQPAIRKQPPLAHAPQLEPLQWCLSDGWLYFRVEEGRLPQAYDLSCCGEQVGITLYDVHDVIIQDLQVRGFWLDGINCHDNVRRTDLMQITARENGRSGISVGGASRVRLDSCVAAGNGEAQVHTEGYCEVRLLDNKLDASSAPALLREGGHVIEERRD